MSERKKCDAALPSTSGSAPPPSVHKPGPSSLRTTSNNSSKSQPCDPSFSDFFKANRIRGCPERVIDAAVTQIATIPMSRKDRVELFGCLATIRNDIFYRAWVGSVKAMSETEKWLNDGMRKVRLQDTLGSMLSFLYLLPLHLEKNRSEPIINEISAKDNRWVKADVLKLAKQILQNWTSQSVGTSGLKRKLRSM